MGRFESSTRTVKSCIFAYCGQALSGTGGTNQASYSLGYLNDNHNAGEGFDLGVVLPNSFSAAWILRRAGIPRIIGYTRNWRGFLLTDRVSPPRKRGAAVPVPINATPISFMIVRTSAKSRLINP